MNILPKKSWHVRNRDNITRVKRDEALAAEEEKKKEGKIALAEQEARTELLRIKARKQQQPTNAYEGQMPLYTTPRESQPAIQQLPRNHINFFSEFESGHKSATTNKDNEAEKKKEQEAYEKKIGLLTYLGQSATETQVIKPWYQRSRRGEEERTKSADTDTNDLKRKTSMDPIKDMMRFLGKKPETGDSSAKTNSDQHSTALKISQTTRNSSGESSILTMFRKYSSKSTDGDRKKSKRKKRKTDPVDSKRELKRQHRRDRKKKHRRTSKHRIHASSESSTDSGGHVSGSSSGHSKSGPSIEQLRAERLRREAMERAKTERLLSGRPLVDKPVAEPQITDKLDGKYNSQFNPQLARKHQPKPPLF